jgi:hypothetical protein
MINLKKYISTKLPNIKFNRPVILVQLSPLNKNKEKLHEEKDGNIIVKE